METTTTLYSSVNRSSGNLNKFKHVNKDLNLSVGTEWELSTDFADRNGFYFIPTLAMKWSF